MVNTLFRQSDVDSPYPIYEERVQNQPLYFDEENNLWALYSYDLCHAFLNDDRAEIPQPEVETHSLLNARALGIRNHLVRLSNPPVHPQWRETVGGLFKSMAPVQVEPLLDSLLDSLLDDAKGHSFDWVRAVCKRLPALAVLHGFGFGKNETRLILERVEDLTGLMTPVATAEGAAGVNRAADDVYPLVETHLLQRGTPALTASAGAGSRFNEVERLELLTSNLIGFLIQSFDAGRGLLSNALLAHVNHGDRSGRALDRAYFEALICETLRFDPPVQNTRRLLNREIKVDDVVLEPGSSVLVVLAAANRDPNYFDDPGRFDISRHNNSAHLTFGAGIHSCPARYFIVDIAAAALTHLFQRYPNLSVSSAQIVYEPTTNVRLPREIQISLHA